MPRRWSTGTAALLVAVGLATAPGEGRAVGFEELERIKGSQYTDCRNKVTSLASPCEECKVSSLGNSSSKCDPQTAEECGPYAGEGCYACYSYGQQCPGDIVVSSDLNCQGPNILGMPQRCRRYFGGAAVAECNGPGPCP